MTKIEVLCRHIFNHAITASSSNPSCPPPPCRPKSRRIPPTKLPTPGPPGGGEVPHGDFPLLIHCGEERTFVVDAKVEDTVLVGQGKRCTEDSAVGGIANRF